MRRIVILIPSLAVLAGVCWLLFANQSSGEQPIRLASADLEKAPAGDPPKTVVLELFTSQGCSSCPPADRLLTAIGSEAFDHAAVIPLAWHVDYWNYIGWSDPFSSAAFSARQHDYARAMKASQIYTPQLILDGKTQLVGSSERAVRGEIARLLKQDDRATVSIEPIDPEASGLRADVRVSLPPDLPPGALRLRVVLFENEISTPVSRGENSGRTLRNDHVVRWASVPMPLHENPEDRYHVEIPIEEKWRRDHLGVAAFVQDSVTLEILGAAMSRPEAR